MGEHRWQMAGGGKIWHRAIKLNGAQRSTKFGKSCISFTSASVTSSLTYFILITLQLLFAARKNTPQRRRIVRKRRINESFITGSLTALFYIQSIIKEIVFSLPGVQLRCAGFRFTCSSVNVDESAILAVGTRRRVTFFELSLLFG